MDRNLLWSSSVFQVLKCKHNIHIKLASNKFQFYMNFMNLLLFQMIKIIKIHAKVIKQNQILAKKCYKKTYKNAFFLITSIMALPLVAMMSKLWNDIVSEGMIYQRFSPKISLLPFLCSLVGQHLFPLSTLVGRPL